MLPTLDPQTASTHAVSTFPDADLSPEAAVDIIALELAADDPGVPENGRRLKKAQAQREVRFITEENNLLRKTVFIIACALPFPFTVYGAEANLKGVDVRTFDVAGVSVGMDMNEAVNALTRHFKIDKSALKVIPPKGYPVAESKENSIFYENGGETISVTLVPRVPIDNNRPQVVTTVAYSLGNTPENKKVMTDAAVAKYGEPNRNIGLTMEWCLTPTSPRGMGVMCELDKNDAILELNLVYLKLKLDDRSWRRAISEYLARPAKPKAGF